MSKLTKQGAKRLLALTILFISGVVVGAMGHSEIMHFFAELFGIE